MGAWGLSWESLGPLRDPSGSSGSPFLVLGGPRGSPWGTLGLLWGSAGALGVSLGLLWGPIVALWGSFGVSLGPYSIKKVMSYLNSFKNLKILGRNAKFEYVHTHNIFSEAKGRKRGAGKGRFRFFVPPSHEDFVGLLYNFIGKGTLGNKHRDFFEKALLF